MGVDARGGHEGNDWGFGLGDEDVAAWRASGLTEDAFVDWLTDRVARRPSGLQARQVYGADDVHEFARRAILDALALGSGDHVLDVGLWGRSSVLLTLWRRAPARPVSITATEMVALDRERAPGSTVVLAEAGNLPFEDATFSAVAMSIVFFFLADPVSVLRECRRVLRPDGGWRSSRPGQSCGALRQRQNRSQEDGPFYADTELAELARQARLSAVTVQRVNGGQLLTARV